MMRFLGAMTVVLGLLGAAYAAQTPAPATTSVSAALACCGDKCKDMGNCCKADAAGKVICSMDGSCCVKP